MIHIFFYGRVKSKVCLNEEIRSRWNFISPSASISPKFSNPPRPIYGSHNKEGTYKENTQNYNFFF